MKIPRIITTLGRFLLASVSVAILIYVAFALLFSTPEEKAIQRENAMYMKTYGALREKEKLVGDAIDNLYLKDGLIYRGLFEAEAPSIDPVTAVDFIAASDSLSDSFFLSYSASKSETLMQMSDNVERNFRAVFDALVDRRDSIPPLSMPVEGLSYVQTGASVGDKLNPVLKVPMVHEGIDLIAPQGTPVRAAADGVVTSITRSRGGLGTQVVIDHGNGYTTTYAMLGDVNTHPGVKVKRGAKIGEVGISSSMFFPHLHYEIRHGDDILNPVDHFFASVTPEEYAKILYMSISTKQSMD